MNARCVRILACKKRAEIPGPIEPLRFSGIYVIVDPEATRGRPVIEVARASLEGGARVVQLRDKLRDKGPMLGNGV